MSFIVVQRLRAKCRKVAWFAENVVCAEFVGTMKVLFPEAKFVVVNHASFSAENRKRAYFASAEFDLTALTRLTGTCTVAEFFDIDQGRGPYFMRSGSSGSKSNCVWLSIDQQAPTTLTSNGLCSCATSAPARSGAFRATIWRSFGALLRSPPRRP